MKGIKLFVTIELSVSLELRKHENSHYQQHN